MVRQGFDPYKNHQMIRKLCNGQIKPATPRAAACIVIYNNLLTQMAKAVPRDLSV